MNSIQLTRLPGWPIKLNEYIVQAQSEKFDLGEYDCCTFAAGAVEAMTGVDPMEEFRGKYNSWKTALKALKKIGQGGLYETLKEKFGEPLRGVYAHKGDVVMYEDCCGIYLSRFGMFIGENGTVYVRLRHIEHVFRVPY